MKNESFNEIYFVGMGRQSKCISEKRFVLQYTTTNSDVSTRADVQFCACPKSAHLDWVEQAKVPDLELVLVDTRTPEEVERDLIREAEKQTLSLFSETQISQKIDGA